MHIEMEKETTSQERLEVCSSREGIKALDEQLALALEEVVHVRVVTIILNAFFISSDFEPADLKQKVSSTFSDIAAELDEPSDDLTTLLDEDKHYSNFEALDQCLCKIANSDTLSLSLKTKFFNAIKAAADKRLNAYISDSVDDRNLVLRNAELPITASYVLDPGAALERLESLRYLKKQIKNAAAACMEALPKESRDSSWHKYVPETEGIQKPLSELVKVVINEDDLDKEEVITAQMQLLRLYREYINTLIAQTIFKEKIVEEQTDTQTINPLRVGESYSKERMRQTRRLALFDSWHLGRKRASDINTQMDPGNRIAIDPRIDELIASGDYKTMPITLEVEDILSEEQLQRLRILKEHAGKKLNSDTYHLILKNILDKLGLLSSSDDTSTQIDAYLEARKGVEYHTYAVYVKDGSRGFALDNRYNLFILPDKISSDLARTLSRFAHEVTHILQRHSRRSAALTILKKFPSVGRSGILADAGAMKIEALVLSLFDRQREVNRYHYDMLVSFIRGGNFWDIFNVANESVRKRELQSPAPKSKKAQIKSAFKVVMRLYNNLGAPGDLERSEGRYPTSTAFLRYLLQAFPPYNKIPFHISGIPSNELGLKLQGFIPTPISASGQEITEGVLLGVIVDSAYEILDKNGII